MSLVTKKTIDWLTMTNSGVLIGLAQGKLPKLLLPVRWLLITWLGVAHWTGTVGED